MIDAPKTLSSSDLYKAAIGEKNQAYYLVRFEKFDEDGARFHASWNWAAFFFTGLWALYRKMYALFFAILALVIIVNMAEKINTPSWVVLLLYLPLLGFAVYGNSIYYRKVKAQIANAQASSTDDRKIISRLNAHSGVHSWTLYIFGAVTVIGIVAAIAIPAYQKNSASKLEFDATTAKPIITENPAEKFWENRSRVDSLVDGDSIKAPTTHSNIVEPMPSQPPRASSFTQSDEGLQKDDDKLTVANKQLEQREYASALKIIIP